VKTCVAAVICWLAALTASAQTPSNGGPAAVPPAVHASVARIVAPGESSVSYGSGTLVFANDQMGIVITNWHVVNEATQPISVHFPDGFYSTATVARVDRDWDLALLAIRKPNAAPVNVAAAAPRPGEVLTIAGYGSGTYRAASGYCTQYVAPGTTFPFEMVEVAVSARQGDSGGPILNQQGELAGVLFGEGNGRTSGSYCGRVRWFLSTVVPDAAAGSLIATTPVGAATSSPASTVRSPVAEPDLPLVAVAQAQASPSPAIPLTMPTSSTSVRPFAPAPPVAQVHPTAAVGEHAQALGWEDIAGTTLGDQVKTVLAIVAILGAIVHVLRWMSVDPAKKS